MNSYIFQQNNKQKQQDRNLTISRGLFLSPRQRERVKALSIQLSKELGLPKTMKLHRNFAPRKLANELIRSGLSLDGCRKIIRQINLLLREFRLNTNHLLTLNGLNLRSLPRGLRRFVMSLILLKAELLNVKRIQREFEARIRREREIEELLNRRSRIDTRVRTPDLEVGRYKKCATAVGLSYGDFIGPIGERSNVAGREYSNREATRNYKNNYRSRDNKKKFYSALAKGNYRVFD